jgi:hypothetical protein
MRNDYRTFTPLGFHMFQVFFTLEIGLQTRLDFQDQRFVDHFTDSILITSQDQYWIHNVISPKHQLLPQKGNKRYVFDFKLTPMKDWAADVFKNMPGFNLSLQMFENMTWYFMVDDDSFVFLDNLAAFLQSQLNDSGLYYGEPFGNPCFQGTFFAQVLLLLLLLLLSFPWN